jgi:hypothetical protein
MFNGFTSLPTPMTARVYVNLSDFKLFSVMQKIGFYPAILLAPRFPPPDHFEHLGLQLAIACYAKTLADPTWTAGKSTIYNIYICIPGPPFVLEKSDAN